jgi:hypothetical protein
MKRGMIFFEGGGQNGSNGLAVRFPARLLGNALNLGACIFGGG